MPRAEPSRPCRPRHRTLTGFSKEADLVATFLPGVCPASAGQVRAFREWPVGHRIADVAVMHFDSAPSLTETGRQLLRLEYPYLRVLAELLIRPLREQSLAMRLIMSVAQVARSLAALLRRGLVSRSPNGAFAVEGWASSLPGRVILYEAKLTDWRCAVEQAVFYRSFATESFVAMPSAMQPRRELRAQCKRQGVGLLFVEPTGALIVSVRPTADRPRSSATHNAVRLHLYQRVLRGLANAATV